VSTPTASDDELARQLWALGDPVRLRLMRLLPQSETDGERRNVSRLAADLKLSQPTVSHHLRVLRQMGIVRCRKEARECYYELDPHGAAQVCRDLALALRCEAANRRAP
jgi:ArsR family transcriptional regulator